MTRADKLIVHIFLIARRRHAADVNCHARSLAQNKRKITEQRATKCRVYFRKLCQGVPTQAHPFKACVSPPPSIRSRHRVGPTKHMRTVSLQALWRRFAVDNVDFDV